MRSGEVQCGKGCAIGRSEDGRRLNGMTISRAGTRAAIRAGDGWCRRCNDEVRGPLALAEWRVQGREWMLQISNFKLRIDLGSDVQTTATTVMVAIAVRSGGLGVGLGGLLLGQFDLGLGITFGDFRLGLGRGLKRFLAGRLSLGCGFSQRNRRTVVVCRTDISDGHGVPFCFALRQRGFTHIGNGGVNLRLLFQCIALIREDAVDLFGSGMEWGARPPRA